MSNRFFKIVAVAAGLWGLPGRGTLQAADTVYMTKAQALAWALPEAGRVEEARRALSDSERAALSRACGLPFGSAVQWYTGYQGDTLTGRALFLDEVGKHQPITFVVALSPEGVVRDVAVAVYREALGDGVRQPRFLDQFQGKREGDGLTLGKDIDGVTGATLSCRAAARAVRRAFAINRELVQTVATPP
ncbi:MAG: FMN-binding protein [Lentisphaerae bacterium]|nr:FMN-binding protein [Lentisphaerota bacterium]